MDLEADSADLVSDPVPGPVIPGLVAAEAMAAPELDLGQRGRVARVEALGALAGLVPGLSGGRVSGAGADESRTRGRADERGC